MPGRTFTVIAICCLAASTLSQAADWPQFRGADSLGYADERNLPINWGGANAKSIVWKSPLPKSDNGFSSPIVCNGRVFLTTVTNKPLTHALLCFNAGDGKLLWQIPIEPGPWKLTDLRGGYGASTPAADGQHVFALFGSAVIACLDYDGKIVWRKELQKTAFDVAIGTSPILFDETVILQLDQNSKKSTLVALDRKTGETRWEQPRPDFVFAHSTPIIAKVHGKQQLIVSGSNALQGTDPQTGKILWSIESKGETVSPAFGDDLVYVDTGRGGGGICVDLSGEKPAVKWKCNAGEMGEGLGSPIIVDGVLYKMHRGDFLLCRKAATGEIVFSEHLPKMSSWPSPVASADHLLYFASAGISYVIKPGPKLDIVATNDLGDSNRAASPAVSDGKIFLRGNNFLYCVGK
jgi:outer membrane protein assembly factor BamB